MKLSPKRAMSTNIGAPESRPRALFPENGTAASIFAVCYAILILLDGCFTGIMITLAPRGENFCMVAAVFLTASLLIIAVSGVAYLLGTKEWQLFPKKSEK